MAEPKVWAFFYGSYINTRVLQEVDLHPEQWEKAKVSGFDIIIRPRANLVRSDNHCVWGILATATHRELDRLYAHAREVLGEIYLPEAVLAQTTTGQWRPALCYIAPNMMSKPATNDYIDRIVGPAEDLRFPAWYIERLASFRTH